MTIVLTSPSSTFIPTFSKPTRKLTLPNTHSTEPHLLYHPSFQSLMEGRRTAGPSQCPVFIYNGASKLEDLKEVNLSGANLFFNGCFRISDLRNVDLTGANIFLNGELQVRYSNADQEFADGWQSEVKVRPPSNMETEIIPYSAPILDVEVMTASHGERSSSATNKIPPFSTSPKASATELQKPLVEVAEEAPKMTSVDHQSQEDDDFCHSRVRNPIPEHILASAISGEHLPRDVKCTSLNNPKRACPSSCEDVALAAGEPDGSFPQQALSVGYDALPVTAATSPSGLVEHMHGANTHRPMVDSLRRPVSRSTPFSPFVNWRWTHDLASSQAPLPPQKRSSTPEITNSSNNETKKQRLGKRDFVDIDKETERLIQEESQRSERARQWSESQNAQGTIADYKKDRHSSAQGTKISTQLLAQPLRPSVPQITASSPRNIGQSGEAQQMPSLPQNSPLNNVISRATLQEEIIQAKVEYNIAQKQLAEEKARGGPPSKQVLARVTHLNERLAALHKERVRLRVDADRMDAFRRCAPRQREDREQAPSKSPAMSIENGEWKNRLSLCYEALQRSKHGHESILGAKSDPETLWATEEPTIKPEKSEKNGLSRVEEARDGVSSMSPHRRVRFSLTDVETFL